MLLTELTLNDLRLLEQFRIERFRSLFAENSSAWMIYIDRDTAVIGCARLEIADRLRVDIAELGEYTWQILGVRSIAIFCERLEVYRGECDRHHSEICELS
jgi:hypothetical protein